MEAGQIEQHKFDFFRIDSRENPSNGYEGKHYSWQTPPETVAEDKIARTEEADVVIVGGGISGLAAAARCGELGLSVILVEKMSGLVAHGAHIATLGSKTMRENGVSIDKKQFARDWIRICGSRVNEDLLWLYMNKSEEALDWLLELGGENVVCLLYGGNYRGPDFTEYAGTHVVMRSDSCKYKFGGALLMCEILQETALNHGAKLYRKTSAKYIEKANGRCSGVIAENADGETVRYAAKKAVILATGDIGGNPELLEKFCPLGLIPKKNGSFPVGSNTGEGHMMGYWAGGAFENAPWALSLHLITYALYTFFFMHVNRQGKRFMNEDTWVQAKAIRCLMQKDGDWAFSVFDSRWYADVTRLAQFAGGQFTDPLLALYGDRWDNEKNDTRRALDNYVEKGLAFKADTIEELAEKMGVPAENLRNTVDRYNENYDMGDDRDYGKRTQLLTPIREAPFYAIKWGPALLTVFGGLLTDTDMRVLDDNKDVVPGLYAVGNVAGGLYGVDYPLLLNGNSHGRALVWARQAAADILAQE
ncbi:MAG: FAD-binding protein [Oscillospiraceae bacterium]|jgi:succinate dehydrogenase/fumarate reductase flavoprotein subunit|nr:FAD-binding protein [Oscillospiraceae bacterium]